VPSRPIATAWPTVASTRSPAAPEMRDTRPVRPDGWMRTASPTRSRPAAIVPSRPPGSAPRATRAIGSRNGWSRSRSASVSALSSRSISVGPWYQGDAAEGFRTLSPFSAEIGTLATLNRPSCAASRRNSSSIRANVFSASSTRSILLTARMTLRMASSDAKNPCRRVAAVTPWRASTTTTRTSAIGAPAARLRVYCSSLADSTTANCFCSVELPVPSCAMSALLPSRAPPHMSIRTVGIRIASSEL
jgi:hypothetical protein